jgi:hypothetical protein
MEEILEEQINKRYNEAIKKWRPSFGSEKDVLIKENIEKLSLKKYSDEEKLNIKSHIIYFIEEHE